MAEVTLGDTGGTGGTDYASIVREISWSMGFGATVPSAFTDTVDNIMNRGMRQFYGAHNWSFMRPITTLTTIAPYSTGTITNGAATGDWTITGGAPSADMESNPTDYFIVVDGSGDTLLEITAMDEGNATVTTAAPTTDVTAGTFVIHHNAAYKLPDNFGGIEGPMTFARTETDTKLFNARIKIVNEGMIRARWNSDPLLTGTPEIAAVRPYKTQTSGTTDGQRFEVVFWPEPDAAYTIDYKYLILPPEVTVTASFPLGGMLHGETIIASCLAVAEDYAQDDKSNHRRERYHEALKRSIMMDSQMNRSEGLGYNSDRSDSRDLSIRDRRDLFSDVTYDGTLYRN